jgi:type II secretory pathway pseudopilin PulG
MLNSVTRRALTITELLVVMASIGLISGLLLPAVMSAREVARRLKCQNNTRQISTALHLYVLSNKTFPNNNPSPWTVEPVRLLDPNLFQSVFVSGGRDTEVAWDFSPIAFQPIPYFLCPTATQITDDGRTISNYGLNHFLPGTRLSALHDGTSNTILTGEIPSEMASLWTWGPLADERNIGSGHIHLNYVSMADGSVHGLAKKLDQSLLLRMLDPADGKVVHFQ